MLMGIFLGRWEGARTHDSEAKGKNSHHGRASLCEAAGASNSRAALKKNLEQLLPV